MNQSRDELEVLSVASLLKEYFVINKNSTLTAGSLTRLLTNWGEPHTSRVCVYVCIIYSASMYVLYIDTTVP